MKIVIDIDDTLYYLGQKRYDAVIKYMGKHNLKYNLIDKTSVIARKMFDWPKEVWLPFYHNELNKIYLNVAPREGAKETMDAWRQSGHQLIIVTARTDEKHINAYSLSKKWLDKNVLPYDVLYVGYEDKKEIFKTIEPDWVIDDSIDTCEICEELGIKFILLSGEHNKQAPKTWRKASSWSEIKKAVDAS